MYPVPVPLKSSLYENEDIACVIHCLPPNVDNENRPDFLQGNYEKGNELLKKTYTALLDVFDQLSS